MLSQPSAVLSIKFCVLVSAYASVLPPLSVKVMSTSSSRPPRRRNSLRNCDSRMSRCRLYVDSLSARSSRDMRRSTISTASIVGDEPSLQQ